MNNKLYFPDYRGRRKIVTQHADERFLDASRFDQNEKDKFELNLDYVLDAAIDEIIDTYKDRQNIYVVHSNRTGIGIVLDWKEDVDYDNGKNHANIVSILPIKKKHSYKKGDIYLVVENEALKKMGKIRLKECCEEGAYDIVKVLNESVQVTFFEGNIWDIGFKEIIVD